MKINIPKSNVLTEYLLMYGEDWVKERFKISGDKLDQLLYGAQLPTKKRQKLRAENITKTISWTKYNNDIEKMFDDLGEDIETADISIIEEVAMKFQEKNKVYIQSEMKDRFVWDKKSKQELLNENMVYEPDEELPEMTDELKKNLLDNYCKIFSRLGHKARRVIDSATSKTKEDGVQELFARNFEKRQIHNLGATMKIIEQDYQKKKVGRGIEIYCLREELQG